MATEKHNSLNAMTPRPDSAVLSALVRRLHEHARGINNAAAKRTIGKDLIAAADVIEQVLADMPANQAAAASMVALLGRDGFASYVGRRA